MSFLRISSSMTKAVSATTSKDVVGSAAPSAEAARAMDAMEGLREMRR